MSILTLSSSPSLVAKAQERRQFVAQMPEVIAYQQHIEGVVTEHPSRATIVTLMSMLADWKPLALVQ